MIQAGEVFTTKRLEDFPTDSYEELTGEDIVPDELVRDIDAELAGATAAAVDADLKAEADAAAEIAAKELAETTAKAEADAAAKAEADAAAKTKGKAKPDDDGF
jgi:hypothetical protein